MKKYFPFLRLFLLGFAGAFMIINLTMCPEESAGPTDIINPGTESKELKELATNAESAFKSGSKENVLKLTYENYAEILQEFIPNDPEKLKKFGEALSKKKLIFTNEIYAEYEVTIDRITYTIAMGNSGDGKWKIIRF